jgi:hypothetical protein
MIKKNILIIIVIAIWLVFSLGYIIWDIWSDFKINQITKAYQAGQTDTINQLIKEAELCQPFSVFNNEKQIQLLKTDCSK